MDYTEYIAFGIVAAAALLLARSFFIKKKKKSCCGENGCPAAEKKPSEQSPQSAQ